MPKLILRCNYLKNAPPSHLANYMNYISTREGVEKIDNTCGLLPATVKQKELIADILSQGDGRACGRRRDGKKILFSQCICH